MKKIVFTTMLSAVMIISHPLGMKQAYAGGFPVIDITNLTQNLLTAVQTLQQLENQVRQMETFSSGSYMGMEAVFGTRNYELSQAISSARGLIGQVNRLKDSYTRTFPQGQQWDNYRSHDYSVFLTQWNNELLDSADDAFRTQQLFHRMEENSREQQRILGMSDGAGGEVRQMQAANQMLSLMSSQLGDVTHSLLSTSRVAATTATMAAAEKKAEQQTKRMLMENYTDIGNPIPISRLP
jgi:conjugal transfer/entry exclusion protein